MRDEPKIDVLVPEERRQAIGRQLLSRRQALAAGAGGLASMYLAACGGSSGGGGGGATASGGAADSLAGKKIEDKILIANWSDYTSPGAYKRFPKQFGPRIVLSGYGSNDELLAKLNAGGAKYDIVVPSQDAVGQIIEQNLARPLDHDLLPNLKNLAGEFTQTQYDPGNKYSVCKDWGITSFYWRADVVEENPKTLLEWFQVLPKYKGKRVNFVEGSSEVIPIALKALGLDLNSENEEDYKKAWKILEPCKDVITSYNSAYIDQLSLGNIDIGFGWNGDAARAIAALKKKDIELKYMVPEGPGYYWTDNWMISAAGESPVAAHAWIDWMLDPKVAGTERNYTQYQIPVEGADQYTDAALAKDPVATLPTALISRFQTTARSPRINELRTKYYSMLKA